MFETVSALGGTGYTLGWPGITESLSAKFRVPSKLIVIVVMIIGRNRVLVDSIDRAVQLDWSHMEEENSNKLLSLTTFD